MSDAHCPECGHYCADHIGQPCVSCFWRLKNEERDRVMGEAAAKAAKEEAVKFRLKDINAALDKIEALKAENEGLASEVADLRGKLMVQEAGHWCEHEHRVRLEGMLEEVHGQRDAYKAQRDELASQIDAMENRTTAVYDGCSGLTEENEELREEVRRLTEVSLGLAAIVVGKG